MKQVDVLLLKTRRHAALTTESPVYNVAFTVYYNTTLNFVFKVYN